MSEPARRARPTPSRRGDDPRRERPAPLGRPRFEQRLAPHEAAAHLDGCMIEMTDVSVEGRSIRTVAVESPDPELVTETIRRLGLEGRRNVCVAQGLKTLLGWGPTQFAVIDVGTNSVKFSLGNRDEGGAPHRTSDTAVVRRRPHWPIWLPCRPFR